MWSESLSWHNTLSLIGGAMLIDTQLFSMVHRLLQEARIPKFKEIFLITWPCRAYPSTGVVNLRCRQRSVDWNKSIEKLMLFCLRLWKRSTVNETFSPFGCTLFVGDWTGTRLTRGTETLDWRLFAVLSCRALQRYNINSYCHWHY